jgi:hypothetical protein
MADHAHSRRDGTTRRWFYTVGCGLELTRSPILSVALILAFAVPVGAWNAGYRLAYLLNENLR